MATGDVLAVIVATIVAILAGVLITVLLMLVRTLRALRTTVAVLQRETRALLDDAHDAVRDAAGEVDRIDRLVTSAEKLDGAQRAAYKTLSSPVVKAMAFGSGVSRAAQRLREGEAAATAAPPRAKGKRGRQAS
jgi:uncharacterized protein YoxC